MWNPVVLVVLLLLASNEMMIHQTKKYFKLKVKIFNYVQFNVKSHLLQFIMVVDQDKDVILVMFIICINIHINNKKPM